MESTSWVTARGESMNYVEEAKQYLKTYSYADATEAARTHKELCRVLLSGLTKVGENIHLASDFLRGPRSADLEKVMRSLRDDVEIFRDEVSSSYVDWKSPRADVIRTIIEKDVQILRNLGALNEKMELLRGSALSSNPTVMLTNATDASERLSKITILFSDRERLCR